MEHGWTDDMSEKNKNGTLYLNAFFKPMIKQKKWKIYHILSPCKPKKFSKLFSKPSYYIIFHQLIFPSTNYLKNIILHECMKKQRGTMVHFHFIVHNTQKMCLKFYTTLVAVCDHWVFYLIIKTKIIITLSHSRLT